MKVINICRICIAQLAPAFGAATLFIIASAMGANQLFADSAVTVVQNGACISGCDNSQTAVTISSLIPLSTPSMQSIIPSFNSAGQVIFNATISGPGLSGAAKQILLRREVSGALTTMASTQTQVSGVAGAVLSSGVMGARTELARILNNDGSVVFTSSINGPGIDTNDNFGVFCLNGSEAVPLLRYGVAPASETTPLQTAYEQNLQKKFEPYIHADYPGCGGVYRGGIGLFGGGTKDGLWFASAGRPTIRLARGLADAPLMGNGITFGAGVAPTQSSAYNLLRTEYTGNSVGDALMLSYLEGTGIRRDPQTDQLPLNNEALWFRTAQGSIRIVARSGDPIPGMPGRLYARLALRTINYPVGVSNDPYYRIGSDGWAVNDRAQVAFIAGTSDSESGSTGSAALTDRSGTIQVAFKSDDIVSNPATNQFWRIATVSAGNMRFTNDGAIYVTGYVNPVDSRGNPVAGLPIKMLFENTASGGTKPIFWEAVTIPDHPEIRIDSSFADASHDAENFFPTDHGTVLITSRTDSSGWGIFRYREGQLALLAKNNSPLPGLNNDYFYFYGGLRPNSKGQFVIRSLGGPIVAGDDTGNFRYVTNSNGSIPNSSEPFLQQYFGTCYQGALNEEGDLPLICNTHLVHYKLSPPELQCLGDFNSDHASSIQDIFDFLNVWFAQDTRADFNHDGSVTVQDLFDFLNAWFVGC